MVKIKIVNRGSQQLPAYATPESAGMDLRANITEPIVLHPLERRIIPTGLYIALPPGYEAQVRPRSGLAFKHGVLLVNLSNEDFTVEAGERIAQMVIARHEQGEFVEVEELDDTERGAGGYGHTGVK